MSKLLVRFKQKTESEKRMIFSVFENETKKKNETHTAPKQEPDSHINETMSNNTINEMISKTNEIRSACTQFWVFLTQQQQQQNGKYHKKTHTLTYYSFRNWKESFILSQIKSPSTEHW